MPSGQALDGTAAAPGRPGGMNAAQMLSAPLDACLLWDAEPWADSLQPRSLEVLRDMRMASQNQGLHRLRKMAG